QDTMSTGQISQFIIVLPEGDQGYWVDQSGGPQWGTYMAHDVVTQIDSRYRTLADRQYRAIGGLSMGGYGALELAILYPDIFGVAGADSPSLHVFADAPPYYAANRTYFDAHDPVYLYKAHPDVARTIKLYIDDGAGDAWLPADQGFHDLLTAQGIPHEWHLFPGGHAGDYWSTHILDYLQFYSSALASPPPATATPAPVATPSEPWQPWLQPSPGTKGMIPLK
ncbi:MAG: esterase family protein, partial [Chloroflexota bacterium]|nr:esterase family protein [Chloroflexota bacterium]